MSFFREHNHRLTGPVLTLLVLMFLFNVGIPSITLSKMSHITIVEDGGTGGTDGKPEEWYSPGVGFDPDLLVKEVPARTVILNSIWRILFNTIEGWI